MRDHIRLIEAFLLLELMSQSEATKIMTDAGAAREDMVSKEAVLAWRRKNLKYLHHDTDGSSDSMALINAAVDYLSRDPVRFDPVTDAPDKGTQYSVVWFSFKPVQKALDKQKKHVTAVLRANDFTFTVYQEKPDQLAISFPSSEDINFQIIRSKIGYGEIVRYSKYWK
jgi:hypothetical protein